MLRKTLEWNSYRLIVAIFLVCVQKSPLRFVRCSKCLQFPLKRGIGKESDFRRACSFKTRIADSMIMLVVESPLAVCPMFEVSAVSP
jgi:hypothetical protein